MRRLLAAALLLAAPFVAGCDSPDDPDSPNGVWAYVGTDVFYFNVTQSAITTYDYQKDPVDNGADCYTSFTLPITKRDGNAFTMQMLTGSPQVWTFAVVGDRLTITFPSGPANTFTRSSKKVSDFVPACSAT